MDVEVARENTVGATADPVVVWGWAGLAPVLLAWACGMWWQFILVTRGVMRWHLTNLAHQTTSELTQLH